MNAREAVLRKLRSRALAEEPLPSLKGPFVEYADLQAQFALALERAAGSLIKLPPGTTLERFLPNLPRIAASQAVCSLIPEIPGNFVVPRRAHDCERVDVVVLRAAFGVAENAALWVCDQGVRQRALFFLAQHVVAVLDPSELVPHMHAAYRRLSLARSPFGCFMAGPSKTADIEQALVIGAHGPRSLSVVMV